MIVPEFWAEARIQQREGRRQITVRRFGWSDVSVAEAQNHADARAREIFDRIAAGAELPRRERKLSYGVEGVPIREEIVDRRGATVITRNIYGARCLNTPNVFFADIDFPAGPPCGLTCALVVVLFLGASAAAGWAFQSVVWALVAGVAGIPLGVAASKAFHGLSIAASGGLEQQARNRVERFLRDRPDWHVRLYRTPAGLRVLVMHRTFDPCEPAVTECFRALRADPIYVRLCASQRCFRARVSPKPWRIGIAAHIRPRPGVWPIRPERMAERTKWIEAYERAARDYAACEFIAALGSLAVCPETVDVQELHDRLCRATDALPTA